MEIVKSTVPPSKIVNSTNKYLCRFLDTHVFLSCSNNNVIDTCSAAGSSDNMYHVNNDIDIDESCSES